MKKNLYVGLHTFHHDGSICTFDRKTLQFKYIKFERLTGKKHQYYDDVNSWVKYLKHLDYHPDEVECVFIVSCGNMLQVADFKRKNHKCNMILVDHHLSHHWSTNNKNSLVFDEVGSEIDTLTVYNKNQQKLKLSNLNMCIGKALNTIWFNFFLNNKAPYEKCDFAGHAMALHAFGKDYSNLIPFQETDKTLEYLEKFSKNFKKEKTFDILSKYVCSLHNFWYQELTKILKDFFNDNDDIYFSGGCGHNIILNTLLKKTFTGFEPIPHCGDEGTSIGALLWGLSTSEGMNLKINTNKLHQFDENFGYASDEIINKAAQFLYEGKLVMWGQGWGEIGPRALGYRSILMNPCVENAKEIINDRIKKRVWFRPYGASVPQEDSEQYFELGHDSPWMLYQANVKDKVKFKNITHADGTCRIQTVNKSNFAYYKLLKSFELLSGFPILINTSMNLPGKPIVGTKKQAVEMFKNSQADVLILGNKIYKK